MDRNRIESLDHLRGLMALSVMTYHYVSWVSGPLGSDSMLGRLGVYAVSIFYVLSGLSLSIVYWGRIQRGADILRFWCKRVFRIFPLYYVVITASLALSLATSVLHGTHYSFPWRAAALNYSLLFGFVDPTAYLSTGAWSIGNEIVFYAIFPLLLYFSRWMASLLLVALAIGVGLAAYFAFYVLLASAPIESQWSNYINPFNQFYLFLSGMAIGVYLRPSNKQGKRVIFAMAGILCVIAFRLIPAQGDAIAIATGWRRLAMSGASVVFVASVFVSNFPAKGFFGRSLGRLGEGCYSIYLLHPLVAVPFVFVLSKYSVNIGYAYVAAFIATLLLSRITYQYLERPMIDAGRRVSERVRGPRALGI